MMKLYLKQCEVVHFLVVIVSMEVGKVNFEFFSLERIREELLMIKRLGGPKSCEFTDSNFNLPQRLEQIYPVLKEINADHYFKFRAEINPEFVDENRLKYLRN
mgnify:CR=1 FL=1